MTTPVDICNQALAWFTQETINDLDDKTLLADKCKQLYDPTRKSVLAGYPWTFASKMIELNQDVEAPLFQFNYQYTLPADFKRLVATDRQINFFGLNPVYYSYFINPNGGVISDLYGDSFALQGKKLLTNDQSKKIIYCFDQKDTSAFPDDFIEAFSLYLASKLIVSLNKDQQAGLTYYQLAEEKMKKVKTSNAQQSPTKPLRSCSMLGVRYQYMGGPLGGI